MRNSDKVWKSATWLLAALLAGLIPAAAQKPNAGTEKNPVASVNGIAQKGNTVWLATKGGLVEYAPASNKGTLYTKAQSGLPDDNILSVAAAADGILAGTSQKGIVRVSGGEVRTLSIDRGVASAPSYQDNNAIAADAKGNIYVAQNSAFYKFDGKAWAKLAVPGTEVSSSIAYKALAFDGDGTLWFGGANSVGSNGLFGSYTDNGGINPVAGIDKVNGIAVDAKGIKWIATGEGLAEYDGSTVRRFTAGNSALPSDNVLAVAAANGKVWAGVDGYVAEYSGGAFTLHKLPGDIAGNHVSALLASGGTLWVGSTLGGLYKLENGEIKRVSMSVEVAQAAKSPADEPTVSQDNEVWISTNEGLIRIDRDNNITRPIASGSDTASVVSYVYADRKGNVWVAMNFSDTCLLKIGGEATTAFLTRDCPFEAGTVSMLSGDAGGTLYVATGKGLFAYDGSNWRGFNDEESPVRNVWVTNVAVDSKGNLWCAVKGVGLYKYDGNSWTPYTLGGILPAGIISALGVDEADRLWVATGESGDGLACFDGSDWTTYNTGNSYLPSDTVTSVAFDNDDNLWVGTKGTDEVSKFDGGSLWQTYNVGASGDVSNLSAGELRSEAVLNGLRARGFSVAISGGGLVGIGSVRAKASGKLTPVYDLSGIRVANPQKGGIYIQNGRKFIQR